MYEYEYRLHIGLHSLIDIKKLLLPFHSNVKTYTVKYVKYFRCKDGSWEIKKKLNHYSVYYLSRWFKFIESEEKAFKHWTLDEYKLFYESIGFYQYPLTIEHRYEVQLTEQAKLFGYIKNGTDFGLVFELEIKYCRKKIKKLPIELEKLNDYKNILHLFINGFELPYELGMCQRKRVYHTSEPIPNAFVAVKHDGIFGLIYSYENYIYEMWEGNNFNIISNTTLGAGLVFAAEKLKNHTVILLDVYQFRGSRVLHLESIFFDFLPSLKLPPNYKIQVYYNSFENVKMSSMSDGIIFHTIDDKIYKLKPIKTIDLLFENGFFLLGDKKIPTNQCLTNGVVYECDLNLKSIRPRPDRFISNSLAQIEEVLPNLF